MEGTTEKRAWLMRDSNFRFSEDIEGRRVDRVEDSQTETRKPVGVEP